MIKLRVLLVAALCILCSGVGYAVDYSFKADDYQKALWMTARFYGAQRMGEGVNWLVDTHEPNQAGNGVSFDASKFVKGKSYLKDADGDYNLTGGWFDCGDFILFGQTFFYSAYMLILGYSEFPEGYDDHYSFDYKGYIKADDYTWEGKKGIPNGIPDILDEVKYATDFMLKAVRDNKTFYFQKGDASDHDTWCTSPVKSATPTSQGGESNGSRAIKKASGGETAMSSLAGATLAAMARLYRKFDPEYADKCLEKALVAYDFAMNTPQGTTDNPGFYVNKPKYVTDLVILCAEMYRATGDKKYLTKAEQYCTWMNDSKDYNYNHSLCYNNTEDLAVYLIASLGSATSYGEKALNVMDFYINTMYKPSSGYILNVKKDASWGTLRYPCNQAFSYALYSKLKGVKTIDPYSLATIEFMMGKNPANRSFIVGFGNKFPVIPHHRNFFRYDGNNMSAVPIPDENYKFIQFGFLVGGNGATLETGAYNESLSNYEISEGGIDYNAGLVGALGYINSMVAPVNTKKFGHPTPELGETQSICGKSSIELDSKVAADGKKTFTWYKDGKKVESSTSANTYKATEAGEYTCEIDSAGDWNTSGTVMIVAALPEVEALSEIELCDPATYLTDFTYDAASKYEWTRDGKEIADAKSGKYEVTKPGEYICAVSAENCGTQEYKFTVSSMLPDVEDAVSDIDGNVTMTVKSEGEYEWYDVAEGGTPVATGSSLKTKITEDKVFYVQDAGAMDVVVGPTQKDFTNASIQGWGEIGAMFKTEKAFMVNSVSGYVYAVYGDNNQLVTATLKQGDKTTKFVSKSTKLAVGSFVTIEFAEPITIDEPGEYTLSFKPANGDFGFQQSNMNYQSFAHQGDPITFTGNDNQKQNSTGFPAIADWNITTGSGCARAVVKAKKGSSASTDLVKSSIVSGMYPNPVEDQLVIELANNSSASVEIVNLLGTVVVKALINGGDNTIDMNGLPTGIYVVRIADGESVYTERIVKK